MSAVKVGIVGYGSFGRFAANVLEKHCDVYVWNEPQVPAEHRVVAFSQLAEMDVIILAIPLEGYEAVLVALRPILRADTVVVDVCSVKMRSSEIILRVLAEHKNIITAHPLFGPESAANGTGGHELIVCNVIGARAEQCVKFCEHTLGLTVKKISAEQHDRVMAYAHVLTFYVARSLAGMTLPEMPFKTPSFNELMDLIDLDSKHTNELFMTIQQGNPFADEVRQEFLRSALAIEDQITKQSC